ncbi:MAG: hypothetical protein JRI72_00050 [Deltaproteobacteria bacterium]|nr:hypothetical protein [Deltaproteobacteria bacterium]
MSTVFVDRIISELEDKNYRSAINRNVRNLVAKGTVGTTEITIWERAENYTYLSSAATISIQSDDENDTIEGTGARTLTVFGLNGSYAEFATTINMDGTNAVEIPNVLRIFNMRVRTAGTGCKNAGVITATYGGTIYAQMNAGRNRTYMGIYTIPAGRTGYSQFFYVSTAAGKDCTVCVNTRRFGEVFVCDIDMPSYEDLRIFHTPAPTPIGERTDIKLSAASSLSSVDITAGMQIILK